MKVRTSMEKIGKNRSDSFMTRFELQTVGWKTQT